ncbi:MAG: Hsp33 family molecular chaperone [Hyphomicrobiaceae bacterium]
MTHVAPSETAAATPRDNFLRPFRTVRSGVGGRLVRLGASADTILKRHDYPIPVSQALGEALVLAAMLGTALRDGKFILQTNTDGPLNFLVADYETPGKLRGYASFDAARVAETDQGTLLGKGHLAMTIDPLGERERYQGIVALSAEPLTVAAHTYFRQSEQLPTFIRVAVARHYVPGEAGAWHWRAGGLMIQKNFPRGERARPGDDDTPGEDDEGWRRTRTLAETVEDHELLDPLLSSNRLLYRLFHEEGVRVFRTVPLSDRCRCSRERVAVVLGSFGPDELAGMQEADGQVTVACQFCNTKYRFPPEEVSNAREKR